MGIRGDVRSISLANVLQDLAMNEQTGTLRIKHKRGQVALWFDRGGLRLVGIGPREGPSLLNGLLALEKIRSEDAPAVNGKQSSEGGFVRGLLKKGKITRDDLKAALQHQMTEHVCDAFLWTDATFEFEEGEPDDRSFDVDQLDLEPRLTVDPVIMEAVRRADEWGETRKAILSSTEILVPDPSRLPPEADGPTKRVFALLDGERSIQDLEELTRLGHFNLLRSAALLIRGGAARPLTAPEAFERARARAGRKEWEAALKMCRYGLDHERKNTGLMELALRAAEALEDHEAAASYARQLASAQSESGHHEAALASYQKVLAHAPKDLTAHERLFSLMLQMDLKLDALAAGEVLAGVYKKAGLPDKALEVYTRLIEKVGDQRDLLESVAEIQRHLGDKQEAVALYMKLADGALQAKDDASALDYYRTILKIDHRNEEALRRRQELETGQVERARRRKRAVRSLVAVGVLAAFVFAACLYEYQARVQHARLYKPINDARDAHNYREALVFYDTVLDAWRWSLVARQLRQERDDSEERFVRDEREEAERREKDGQLVEAIQRLEEARVLVRQPALRGTLDSKISALHEERAKEEKKQIAALARMTPEEIKAVKTPLAVPALEKLLAHTNPEVRNAAVGALGKIEGAGAVAALIKALADPGPAISTWAAALLVERKSSPFRADLVAPRAQFKAGETFPLEWRVTNLSPATVELTLEAAAGAALKLEGPNGPLKLSYDTAAEKRTVRLGKGEYVGGSFPDITLPMSVPGVYKATWTASFTWAGQKLQLPAPTFTLERTR